MKFPYAQSKTRTPEGREYQALLPLIPIGVRSQDRTIRDMALLDSGAETSMFHTGMIRIEPGAPPRTEGSRTESLAGKASLTSSGSSSTAQYSKKRRTCNRSGSRKRLEKELKTAEAKLHGADAFEGKLDEVFVLLQEFETVWSKMTPVQQRVVYRGGFNYLKVEGVKWRRQFKVEDFSLKPLFESWYHGRVWNAPILLTDADFGIVTDNQGNE